MSYLGSFFEGHTCCVLFSEEVKLYLPYSILAVVTLTVTAAALVGATTAMLWMRQLDAEGQYFKLVLRTWMPRGLAVVFLCCFRHRRGNVVLRARTSRTGGYICEADVQTTECKAGISTE